VVREAGIIAAALRASLTLVHNIDPKASQLAQRIGYPLSQPLANLLAMRLREGLEQAAVGSQVLITRDSANAHAVLEVAQAQSADLLVVGVKPLAEVRTRTADAILDAASQSVLFIPLPSASKSLLLD
jgi:nucleotide-binding universal stress UspA family protein